MSDDFSFKDFLDEKLGYPTPASYDEWLKLNHYQQLESKTMNELYVLEREFASRNEDQSIIRIADRRLNEFRKALQEYIH